MNMIACGNRVDVLDVYVEDVEGTKSFYEKVFGLPATRHPDCVDFTFGDTILHLRDVSSAAEFIGPAEVASSADGSRGVFTIFVADVDAACAELARRGVGLVNGPADRSWGLRTACFADPAGQIWELAALREDGVPGSGAGARTWDGTEKRIGSIALFVEDLQRAQSFYRDGFGLPAGHDSHDFADFRFDRMTIRLLDIPRARQLVEPATVAGPADGLRFTFCVFVENVDAVLDELADCGVQLFKGPVDMSFGHRIASVRDPGGHIWEVVGQIS